MGDSSSCTGDDNQSDVAALITKQIAAVESSQSSLQEYLENLTRDVQSAVHSSLETLVKQQGDRFSQKGVFIDSDSSDVVRLNNLLIGFGQMLVDENGNPGIVEIKQLDSDHNGKGQYTIWFKRVDGPGSAAGTN